MDSDLVIVSSWFSSMAMEYDIDEKILYIRSFNGTLLSVWTGQKQAKPWEKCMEESALHMQMGI